MGILFNIGVLDQKYEMGRNLRVIVTEWGVGLG